MPQITEEKIVYIKVHTYIVPIQVERYSPFTDIANDKIRQTTCTVYLMTYLTYPAVMNLPNLGLFNYRIINSEIIKTKTFRVYSGRRHDKPQLLAESHMANTRATRKMGRTTCGHFRSPDLRHTTYYRYIHTSHSSNSCLYTQWVVSSWRFSWQIISVLQVNNFTEPVCTLQ